MPRKRRVRKSRNLQALISWDGEHDRFLVEDVIWPKEKPYEATTEHDVIEIDLTRGSLGDSSQWETFFAVLQAHDLHGSEEMRSVVKSMLEVFLVSLVDRDLILIKRI